MKTLINLFNRIFRKKYFFVSFTVEQEKVVKFGNGTISVENGLFNLNEIESQIKHFARNDTVTIISFHEISRREYNASEAY